MRYWLHRYDTAQNSLIGAKKQFADSVQNAEKQFLQDETIKSELLCLRCAVLVTCHASTIR